MDKFIKVFKTVQLSKANHPKSYIYICNLYKHISHQEFYESYLKILTCIFSQQLERRTSPILLNCLEFFVNAALKIHNLSIENDMFLVKVIKFVLKFINNIDVSFRIYSCKFFHLLFVDGKIQLNKAIYDLIQNALDERLMDQRFVVRLEAVQAIHQLQDSTNDNCEIMRLLILKLHDTSYSVRKEAVRYLIPCAVTIPNIIERLNDVDYRVRQIVFWKISLITPKCLKVIDRFNVLMSGFSEQQPIVKKTFIETMLPKWLICYKGNFMKFLAAVQFDGDECHLKASAILSRNIMQAFFKDYRIKDIVACLPLDDDKLLPMDTLSSEMVSYWSLLHKQLIRNEEFEILENIIPELKIFCNYIERIINETSLEDLENWQKLEFAFVVTKLIDMASCFDLGDEVGRQTLHSLITTTLIEQKLDITIIQKMIDVLASLSANSDTLIGEVNDIICNIKNVDLFSPEDAAREKTTKIAELNVKIDTLNRELEDAITSNNLDVAFQKQEEIKRLGKIKKDLEQNNEIENGTKTDLETLIRCLDIAIALLKLPIVKKLTETLKEMINDLRDSADESHNWDTRILELHVLAAIIDKKFAVDNLRLFVLPLVVHRDSSEETNIADIACCVSAVCDLLCFYGPTLFEIRKCNQELGTVDSIDISKISAEDVIQLLYDLKYDDCNTIGNRVGTALSRLLYWNIMVTPKMISVILLLWSNPTTEKLHQLIDITFTRYLELKGAVDVIKLAVIPTVKELVRTWNANIDTVLNLMVYLTNTNNKKGRNVHLSLSLLLCDEILLTPRNRLSKYLIILLTSLDVLMDDMEGVRKLVSKIDSILEKKPSIQDANRLKKLKAELLQSIEDKLVGSKKKRKPRKSISTYDRMIQSTISPNNGSNCGLNGTGNKKKRKSVETSSQEHSQALLLIDEALGTENDATKGGNETITSNSRPRKSVENPENNEASLTQGANTQKPNGKRHRKSAKNPIENIEASLTQGSNRKTATNDIDALIRKYTQASLPTDEAQNITSKWKIPRKSVKNPLEEKTSTHGAKTQNETLNRKTHSKSVKNPIHEINETSLRQRAKIPRKSNTNDIDALIQKYSEASPSTNKAQNYATKIANEETITSNRKRHRKSVNYSAIQENNDATMTPKSYKSTTDDIDALIRKYIDAAPTRQISHTQNDATSNESQIPESLSTSLTSLQLGEGANSMCDSSVSSTKRKRFQQFEFEVISFKDASGYKRKRQD